VLSFAVLHELTAISPLLLFFFAFQAAGVGGSVVEWAAGVSERSQDEHGQLDWRIKVGEWLDEGEKRVDRVSRRYGLFGRTKGEKASEGHLQDTPAEAAMQVVTAAKGSKAAADVANALAAYLLVKVSCSKRPPV
jgi:hypothetical protein